MKGNRDVINQLNQVLYHHLTAINQYFLHSRMFNDWGIEKLGSAEYKESIRQMKHADKIIAISKLDCEYMSLPYDLIKVQRLTHVR